MVRAIDDSKKQSYTLVRFGVNGVNYRFTNWGTPIDPNGDNWISTPTMDVQWPRNTGTLAANNCMITVREDANSTMQTLVDLLLTDGTPTAPVEVEIREVILPVRSGDIATELIPFRGRVLRAVKNADGRAHQVRFEVQSIKARLDIPLGLPCNHHCVWALFGKGCSVQGGAGARGPQLSVELRLRTVSAINGKEITLNSDPALTGSKSFRFGYVLFNNVRIGIQDWDSGDPTKVNLRQQPPASWISQVITLVPGCDKTIETCRAAWNNEANFGGAGYALPAYNPHFEDGA